MCILFFALGQHPNYPVIICANRDEFHQRPTQKMHFWPNSDILAGKDLQAGGTWLGLNKQGDFSALTNFRLPAEFDQKKKSRGELVLNALTSISNNKQIEFQQNLLDTAEQYNGYNLVFGPINNLQSFDSVNKKTTPLTTGIHSLCNGALDDIWPKMALGQQQLTNELSTEFSNNKSINVERLFSLMQNQQQAAPEHLPQTGISQDWEQFLSAIFIVSPEYGTRTTTIIMQDQQGNIEVADRSYNALGQCTNQQHFEL